MIKFGVKILYAPNPKSVGKWVYETKDINDAFRYIAICRDNYPEIKYEVKEKRRTSKSR